MPWLDLAGVRYIIAKDKQLTFSDGSGANVLKYFVKRDMGPVTVYENIDALPRTFIAIQARAFADYRSVYSFMAKNPELDFRNTVVLETSDIENSESGAVTSEVKIEKYLPDQVDISTRCNSPGYLVLTDTYYPGWSATVNGKTGKILRADGPFRGVKIPAGENRIEFRYEPLSFRIGLWFTLSTLLTTVILIITKNRHSE